MSLRKLKSVNSKGRCSAQQRHQFLTHTLRVASVPEFYAQHVLKGPFSNICAFSACISSWHLCSAPDAYAQCTHQFLTCMLRVYKMNIWKMENWCACWACVKELMCLAYSGCASVPNAYAQGAHQFLIHMLSVRISSWPICLACT